MTVVEVRVEDGVQAILTSQKWLTVGRLAWLSDGSGLIMTAADQESAFQQMWRLSYPGGEARRITNDLNGYQDLSLTADSTALVTVQSDQLSNIWTISNKEDGRATQLTSNKRDGIYGVTWTPDGKIVYASNVSGNEDIWIMDADGKSQTQLTSDARRNYAPTVSSDGRYIVFVSNRTGRENLWRMEIDGSSLTQLTTDGGGRPNYSPDSRWLVYTAEVMGQQRVLKVSMDGGEPVQLTDHASGRNEISPDGKQIVCGYFDDTDELNQRWKFALIPFAGGTPSRMFEIPPTMPFFGSFLWAPDGRALTYINDRNGVSNIWRQPIDGGAPKQLTDLKSDRIFNFAWSRDGKWLALARGEVNNDVVLISNFKDQR